ncbi:putative sodium-and lithium-tolerant 1 protein [Klebsormidium nitens]|uniref:Putative sodium-and lithium-tolerant 1 protein n=1 Tax=Klebsormidium nitens TaxID=105231 RepID=A0A1Y1HU12_KLENI|nr:putative sodium-and lithium-tolerant 1 protein [Klebsormidium nitens]|eukprot:GAQ79328.1 putative sodium-and lithium-tolerant 1 protein [Klebsormidium nitens]
MGFRSCEQAAPLHRSSRQDPAFADSAPSFVEFNEHQTASLDSLVPHSNEPTARYIETPHLPPASLDIHLGARRYRATSSQMLHLPLEITTDVAPGRNFAMPSPTNVSLLNNFPFASPDINEPGSPLGYDLNSGILDSNLENFSNSLLDINADANGLNFSPSSDLNLSPQESPIFQLFTGPSLELGLPSNPDKPVQDTPSKDSDTLPPASLTLQGTPLMTQPAESSPRRDSYADLSVASIVQQKRDDIFWAAWFFFSHYFEPVLTQGAKDLSMPLDQGPLNMGQQIDRQVFVVQNDLENSYMWYLSARPANMLGRMQLQSYINGRHQAGQAAFPYSISNGFIRSHKLQRKKYKGLSNPQCIHGVQPVDASTFSGATPEQKRRFEELTSRPLGTPLPPEAADYNAWRKVPERSEASPSVDTTAAAEPLSQTIQFLPGQESQEPPPKPPASSPEPLGNKVGGRAAKKRKKGSGPKSCAANEGPPSGPTGERGMFGGGGAEELLLRGGAGNSPEVQGSEREGAGVGDRMTRLRESLTNGGRTTQRTPVTDLTLQWQAEIEQGRSHLWGPSSNGAHASAAAKLRAAEQRSQLTVPDSAATDVRREPFRSGRVLTSENAPTVGTTCNGTEGLESRLAGPAFGQSGEGAAAQSRLRDAQLHPSNTDTRQRRGSMQANSGQAVSELHRWGGGGPAETVSEDCPPAELTGSLDGTEVSGPSRRPFPSPQAQRQPAPAGAQLGSVPLAVQDLSRAQLGAGVMPRAAPEALYEDEAGYLLFVSLPFTDLKQVRVTWRNVGETGIVKVDGVGPARGLARGSRVLRLSSWGRAGGDAAREIMLPTRIPDDASIEAHFSAECAGLEISVPKHAACTEERPVRLFLPEQRQLPRGS